jgi:hypothetical protein
MIKVNNLSKKYNGTTNAIDSLELKAKALG